MSTIRAFKPRPNPPNETIADLLRRLGNIPADRVRLHPLPGTATEKDVIRVLDQENRPCELVEGTLVEKAMGYEESAIAAYLMVLLKGDQALDGGNVLPGFSLPLAALFARNEP